MNYITKVYENNGLMAVENLAEWMNKKCNEAFELGYLLVSQSVTSHNTSLIAVLTFKKLR